MAALIAARRADGIPVAVACRALGSSRAWFYKHNNARLPPRAQRREQLKAEVAGLFALHEGKYGSHAIGYADPGPGVHSPWIGRLLRKAE